MRVIVALLALVSVVGAEPVYFTPNGKTYCVNRKCLTLTRAKVVLSADRAEAESHGLVRSGADKPRGASGRKTRNGWANPAAKETR